MTRKRTKPRPPTASPPEKPPTAMDMEFGRWVRGSDGSWVRERRTR